MWQPTCCSLFSTRDYHCYCEDGFTGDHCQTDWDECWSGPCLNGATCVDQIADFNCTCPSGFSGKHTTPPQGRPPAPMSSMLFLIPSVERALYESGPLGFRVEHTTTPWVSALPPYPQLVPCRYLILVIHVTGKLLPAIDIDHDKGSISPPFLRFFVQRSQKRKKYSQVVSIFLRFWDVN